MTPKIAIIGGALLAITFMLVASGKNPRDYNECIEMNIEKAQTRESSLIVDRMCRKRFPKKLLTDEDVFGR